MLILGLVFSVLIICVVGVFARVSEDAHLYQ